MLLSITLRASHLFKILLFTLQKILLGTEFSSQFFYHSNNKSSDILLVQIYCKELSLSYQVKLDFFRYYIFKFVSNIFLFFHQIIALKNYEKRFLFHLESFFVLKIFKFLYFLFPFFHPVSHCLRR